jgi:hypothetical protein
MKRTMRRFGLSMCVCGGILVLLCLADVRGQGARRPAAGGSSSPVATISKLEPGYVASPSFGVQMPAGKGMATGNGEWLQMYTLYATQGGQGIDVDGHSTWHDEVTVEWFVMVAPRNAKKPILMHRSVTYVDVEDAKREHCSDVYIRPSFLKRYGGANRLGRRELKMYVRIKIGGQTVAIHSSDATDKTRWWESERVESRDSELLIRSETPFAAVDYDRYEQVKATKGSE